MEKIDWPITRLWIALNVKKPGITFILKDFLQNFCLFLGAVSGYKQTQVYLADTPQKVSNQIYHRSTSLNQVYHRIVGAVPISVDILYN